MKYRFSLLGLVGIFFFLESCIDPFSPPEITSARQYLVVDGFLDVGSDTSWIRLSRTQNILDTDQPTQENGAQVRVQGDRGSTFPFAQVGGGRYMLPPQSFQEAEQFRLYIRTSGGYEYYSDYVPIKKTPPIDSITYKVDEARDGIQFYVNTQDPQSNTRFYRWKFEETWEYSMPLYSAYEIQDGAVVDRRENINTCWSSTKPATILVGTTVKLSQDVLRQHPITFVSASTGKLRSRYSILLKQYALTQEGFQYWISLAKTTEQTGSLFDPLPSQITGNIKCITDPQELAFGFFSASASQEKRLLIAPRMGRMGFCPIIDTLDRFKVLETQEMIISEYFGENAIFPDYLIGTVSCADCRTRGGTTTKPSYWP
ncbi:hypothetical protein GCM10027275_20040 [Rhabdobacter roseus]|uniref:DUF4249 domain-containing protein n=1 Tax=Rhabdobacter roseus TaxID=1655419 RepID=A0A840TLY6_9BACT|nr:DUF4249 domain-containing protein [Rhabdobacter roseus]MBB5283935.1 hypothetical protein [Rhabdobacter roseus]